MMKRFMVGGLGGAASSPRHEVRRWCRGLTAALLSVAMVAGQVATTPATAQEPSPEPGVGDESALRIGVLAVADAIATIGKLPELAQPLPFTRTSLSDVLRLDDLVTEDLIDALSNPATADNLALALEEVPGLTDIEVSDTTVSFAYSQTATTDLELAFDDGDLRLGRPPSGIITVELATLDDPTDDDEERFVMRVDETQDDPLLRFVVVSEPELELTTTATVDFGDGSDIGARQGFTELAVGGGSYALNHARKLTLRDPNGRGELRLEDLRYSTLVDLFRVEVLPRPNSAASDLAVAFDIALPGDITVRGGESEASLGTIALTGDADTAAGWPDPAANRVEIYGDALDKLTDLTVVDGITAFAEYTGAALALQNAADVDFPNLGGSLIDVAAPADQLMEVLSASALAEIRCGLTPDNPPIGLAVPGDTVYCDAVTAEGLADGATVTDINWFMPNYGDGPDGVIATPGDEQGGTVALQPKATVQVSGSDGQPDIGVSFTVTAKDASGAEISTDYVARTLPLTVQELTRRIDSLDDIDGIGALPVGANLLTGTTTTTVDVGADRLEVTVALAEPTPSGVSAPLTVGDPATLGALVGLTGLGSRDDATVTATATGASFDVGFAIPFDTTGTDPDDPADDPPLVLVPSDPTLLEVGALAASSPSGLTNLPAQMGFLGVTADVTELTLGSVGGPNPVVALRRQDGTAGEITLNELFLNDGGVAGNALTLASALTATIRLTATEEQVQGRNLVGGEPGAANGWVRVAWGAGGVLPDIQFDSAGGYQALRIFDPVAAVLIRGTAVEATPADPSTVEVNVTAASPGPAAVDLLDLFGVDAGSEVARRVQGPGVGCQSLTIVGAATITCEGLAMLRDDDGNLPTDPVGLIVFGDPAFVRNNLIEGLSRTINDFDQLTGDNNGGDPDQFASTLPLVDLLPREMAPERLTLLQGMAALLQAAAEDDAGTSAEPQVSSAQALAANIADLVSLPDAGVAYAVDGSTLGVTVTSGTVTDEIAAALRFEAKQPAVSPDDISPLVGQIIGSPLPITVSSQTTLDLDLDVDTGVVTIGAGTGSSSTASLPDGGAPVDEELQVGAGMMPVVATAELGVTVDTGLVGVELVTQARVGLIGDPATNGARLTLPGAAADPDDDIVYTWLATESSGGGGAVADTTPEPMDLRLLASGLSSLAGALEVALDGGTPGNVTGGAPLAAPLIGTDLDAGAEIPAVVADMRDQIDQALRGPAPDGDDVVGTVEGAAPATAIDVTASCFVDEARTDGCGEGDGATTWHTVTLKMTLTGTVAHEPGDPNAIPFQVGLDGLAVRSNETIGSSASWTLPVTLELVRGEGPKVAMDGALSVVIDAELPAAGDAQARITDLFGAEAYDEACDNAADPVDYCLPAIVGYLPAVLTATGAGGELHTQVTVSSTAGSLSVLEVDEGGLDPSVGFADQDPATAAPDGLELGFVTTASNFGSFDLLGDIVVPWTAGGGFAGVSYQDVKLDVGEVIAGLVRPIAVADPYLGPLRDVVDQLRKPIPVVSDLSALAGAGEVSLLRLLDDLSAVDPSSKGSKNKKLELAFKIISYVEKAASLAASVDTALDALEALGQQQVPLDDLAGLGALLTIEPQNLTLREACGETVRSIAIEAEVGDEGDEDKVTLARNQPKTADCPNDPTSLGLGKPSLEIDRKGNVRKFKADYNTSVAQTVGNVSASMPGFSLPFLNDPNQLIDVLTGEGEASYFRLDLGSLSASVSYTQKFAPIPIGPVPVQPFIGGSIGIEGRMAMGFDSRPQTLAVESLADPGDVGGLVAILDDQDSFSGDILAEGFYLDDLNADGVDVPEIKFITTIEAGAGVSIGIASAGIKGGITLTIGLDMNDPNDDGRIRIAEIRDEWGDRPECIFDVEATLAAFLKFFFEIDLFFTSFGADFDIVRLGPYTLFEYSCEEAPLPNLVDLNDTNLVLATHVDETFEVRQFDTGGGATGGGMTVFEVAARGLIQRVEIEPAEAPATGFTVTRYEVAEAVPTTGTEIGTLVSFDALRFSAPATDADNLWSFLAGETYDDSDVLVTTRFGLPVTADGGVGADAIVTGDGDDTVTGGPGEDRIDTGAGDDTASGGSDNDALRGGPGLDNLAGGGGDDDLQGGPGPDLIAGGPGDDFLLGGPGRHVDAVIESASALPPPDAPAAVPADVVANVTEQVINGFDTGDILIGGGGSDVVDGADGGDIVVGGDAAYTTADIGPAPTRSVDVEYTYRDGVSILEASVPVTGLETANRPTDTKLDELCVSGPAVVGTTSNDVVTGGPEDDVLVGSDGPDTLTGGTGADEICGLAGDDYILGDNNADSAADPAAAAALNGAGDGDVIRGGHGADRISAGPGDDLVFGDDTDLVVDGDRMLDGSIRPVNTERDLGNGNDYIEAAEGDDTVAGGAGADLIVAGTGNDLVAGEGRNVAGSDSDPNPSSAQRLVDCRPITRIVAGHADLNGDLLASRLVPESLTSVDADYGQLAGLQVDGGLILGPDGNFFTGLIGGSVVVVRGLIDLDRDGVTYDDGDPDTGAQAPAEPDTTVDAGTEDTGLVDLASMRVELAADGVALNPDGDCILGGPGDDALLGGLGSDHVAGGADTDLVDGGVGDNLLLGDAGTDVLIGGVHDDVLVGGDGDDHLSGGPGRDRLRGNEGNDDLIGGTNDPVDPPEGFEPEAFEETLIGGRGDDVLAGDDASVASASIVDAVSNAAWSAPDEALPIPADVLAASRGDSAVYCGNSPPPTPNRWVTLAASAPAHDELFGGFGCDWVLGQEGDDLVRGGQDDDYVEGGPGADEARGDAGDDLVIGGSSVNVADDGAFVTDRSGEGAPDGSDTLIGDGGPDRLVGDDVLVGDNGTIRRSTGADPVIELADVDSNGAGTAGEDELFGDGGLTGSAGGDDRLFGQYGDDTLNGEAGDDYLEGGPDADSLFGAAGNDDIIGGSSSHGRATGDGGRLVEVITSLLAADAAGLPDVGDVVDAGSGHDVVLGDNGRITRPIGLIVVGLVGPARDVAMADIAAGDTSGSDVVDGGSGNDHLYGQLDDSGMDLASGDRLNGHSGDDVIVADLGVIAPTAATDLGAPDVLGAKGTSIAEPVYQPGTVVPVTRVPNGTATVGGADLAFGGPGADVLRMGGGDDLANGESGDDVVFGGFGDDVLWGGPDHDRVFGGYGQDLLDIKPRATDPAVYTAVASTVDTDGNASTVNGADLLYGGWGPDELQADVGGTGRVAVSDYLIDWVGNYNLAYVCDGGRGRGRIIRSGNPSIRDLLSGLAVAAGATAIETPDSGGWHDLGLVQKGDNSANSGQHPNRPGSFYCEGAPGDAK